MLLKEYLDKKKKEKIKQEKKRIIKKVAIGTFSGVAAGILGGILAAPKSGKETREDIKNKSIDVKNSTSAKVSEIKENIDTKTLDARQKIKGKAEEIKSKAQEAKIMVAEATEKFKNKKNKFSEEPVLENDKLAESSTDSPEEIVKED
jgi:gas vesicle protein